MAKAEPKYEDLVERLQTLGFMGDSDAAFLKTIVETYGLTHVAYLGVRLPGRTQPCGAASYPTEWIDRYAASGYMSVDPVVLGTLKSLTPLDWLSLDRKSANYKKIFGEAGEFGIGEQGLSFPMRGPKGESALLSVVGEKTSLRRWNSFKRKHLRELYLLAYYVHHRAVASLSDRPGTVRLSPRENACLQWAARGKTMEEIGTILGISGNTVRVYLDASRRKLNCSNIAHSVAAALTLGLIEPP